MIWFVLHCDMFSIEGSGKCQEKHSDNQEHLFQKLTYEV